MPAGGAEFGAAARGQGGGLSAARLWQEARHPQVEVTTDSQSLWPGPSATRSPVLPGRAQSEPAWPDPDWGVGWAGVGGRSNFTMPTSAVAPAGGPGA